MGAETLISFCIASVMLALVPGPDNIFVVTHAVIRGRDAGLAVVLGLCTGLLVHTTLVALGIAVVFQTSIWAFTLLKTIGAGYLLYLAWQAATAVPPALDDDMTNRSGFGWFYRRGIIMNLTNPKVLLFFLAFLPQFVVPGSDGVTVQIIVLGGLFILVTIMVFGTMALMAGRMSHLLRRSPLFHKTLNYLASLVFAGLALHLLLSQHG